ncbi:Piwi-like domain-containing protein [Metarhizium anisopliae]
MITGLATQMDGRDNQYPPRIVGFGAGPKDVEFFLAGSLSQPKRAEGHKKGKKVQVAGPSQRVDGRYVSVYEHFEETYKIIIRDTTLPVINVGIQKNPSYLPWEVCHVLPGQPARSQLSPNQVQQTIRFAVRKPTFNAQSIATSGLQTLGLSPTCPTLTLFGIQARPELIAVPGRVLAPPVVKYCGGKAADHRYGSWNLRSLQVNSAANLARGTYLSISVRGKDHPWANILELKSLLDRFRDTLRKLGINAGECVKGLDIEVNPHNADAQVDIAIRCFATSQNPPQLLLVILPASDNVALYNRVKFACHVEAGLINVCVVGSKFAKVDEHYYANVGLKVNLKLRGQNYYIDGSQVGILGEGKTMLVGIHVTHPSPGSSQNAPSVAGIVASVDKQLAQWPAELRIQAAQQEMVSGLDDLLKSRLVLCRKHNPSYPENILVCRDGVSEGEYRRVLDQEEPHGQPTTRLFSMRSFVADR